MTFDFTRFVTLVFPYVLFSTLAAFILFGEEIKPRLPRLLLYVLIASITQTLTYHIPLEGVRFVVEVISGYFIFYLVFREPWGWSLKIFTVSYIIGTVFCLIGLITAGTLFQIPLNASSNSVKVWLLISFVNLMAIPIVYIIRRSSPTVVNAMKSLTKYIMDYRAIFIAVSLQGLFLVGLASQLVWTSSNQDFAYDLSIYIGLMITLGLSAFVFVKYLQADRRKFVISIQDTVSEGVTDLINEVKGQRHDFLNHLQVIDWFSQKQEFDSLRQYVDNLVKEVSHYNEFLKIPNPFIGAVLNIKISQANSKGINIKADIDTNFQGYEYKSMDIARILANLIDNAIEAVESGDVKRDIEVRIYTKGSMLFVEVSNEFKGSLETEKIFEVGVTSKGEGHSGLGLYISQQLAKKNNGYMHCFLPEPDLVCFTLAVSK